MESEIGQLRSRRRTISADQSLEDRMDISLKISSNLTLEFDRQHQEFEGKVSDFEVYKDGCIQTNEHLTDKKKEKTSVSTPPCLITEDDETAKISSLLPSLGQLDATAGYDNNDGFKTPTDEAHMIPPLTECPPAPKIKKRTCYDSPVKSSAAVGPRRCRRKLMFDGFDLMAGLKIQEDEDKCISAP